MSPERQKQLDELFQEAVTQAPDQQDVWLAQACSGDAELLSEARARLAASSSPSTNSSSAASSEPQPPAAAASIRRAGPYLLTRQIGKGGMGAVYLGERDDGEYEAQVAVKLIRAGLDTEYFLARFQRERRALGRLQHPNIARIFDSGTTADGVPYIVMELVHGVPITAYARDRKLTVDQILSLYLEVCRAVSHAHQKLVVHRDLKPGNILVQDDGAPKLLDFGICKLIEDDGPRADTLTGAHLMMTPAYASPEQVRGEPVTALSDIYSLGAVLYELLAGRPPHIITSASPAALVAVCEEAVPEPSRVARDPARAAELGAAAGLDAVVLKALDKQPSRRYQTVERLAEDLRRVLSRETAQAVTDPSVPLSQAPRRRFALAPVAAALAVLVVASSGFLWWNRTRQQQELRARQVQSAKVREQADHLFELRTRAAVTEARSLAEAAIALDPDNGPAHNLLAEIHTAMLAENWVADPAAIQQRAIEEAQAAIRLAPHLESAWAAWISLNLRPRLNLPRALAACREALAQLPQGADVLAVCARAQWIAGNAEIALLLVRQLEATPSRGLDKLVSLSTLYFHLGRAGELRSTCQQVFAIEPHQLLCEVFEAHLLSAAGRPAEALARLRLLDTDANRNRGELLRVLAFLAAGAGDNRYAAALRERIARLGPPQSLFSADVLMQLARGEIEPALDRLERAAADREEWATQIILNAGALSPALARHERLARLLERLRMPPSP